MSGDVYEAIGVLRADIGTLRQFIASPDDSSLMRDAIKILARQEISRRFAYLKKLENANGIKVAA